MTCIQLNVLNYETGFEEFSGRLSIIFYQFSSFSFESLAYRFTRMNKKKKKKKKKQSPKKIKRLYRVTQIQEEKKDIDIANKKGTVQLTFLSLCFHNPKHNFHKP